MIRFGSIRARLTLWYLLLLALTLAIFSGGVYFALRASLYGSLDDSIQSRIEIIRSVSVRWRPCEKRFSAYGSEWTSEGDP